MPLRYNTYRRGGRLGYRKKALKRVSRRYRTKYNFLRNIVSSRVHYFKRTVQFEPITINDTQQFGALKFQLNQLPNYTEFTALFDVYRVSAIKIKFVPDYGTGSLNPLTTNVLFGCFHTAIDRNDDTPVGSLDELLQYDTYKQTRLTSYHSRYFKPMTKITDASFKKKWYDTSDDDEAYYGIKYVADGTNISGGTLGNLTPYVTFYFQCKNVI